MDASMRLEAIAKSLNEIEIFAIAVRDDPALREDIRTRIMEVYELACQAGHVLHDLQPYTRP